jgi:MoxR-like ATPase
MTEEETPYQPIAAELEPQPIQAPPQSYATQVFYAIRQELKKVFIGQDDVAGQVLAALLAGGHVLLEGKPGLGKTWCWLWRKHLEVLLDGFSSHLI